MKIFMTNNLAGTNFKSCRGFTLTELLVVIAIMGVLAGFTIPVLKSVKRQQYIRTAGGEMQAIETALENYKAKYGTYPPGNALAVNPPYQPSQLNQLYYELAGTTQTGGNFVTLDSSATIQIASVNTAYGVGGFVNCSKGTGEDGVTAKNFLVGLSSKNIQSYVTNNQVATTILVTSVGGPDDAYKPLNASGVNPFRYVYPGVNNPGGYDLWVQLVISGKTNLVCNWSRQVQINSPLP
jgi:prepilin-type N-terminal cleavage/methylation domain-containing protein